MAKPGYTTTVAVTDAAETTITAHTYCNSIYVAESSTTSGWPRSFLVRGSVPTSAQIAQTQGAQYEFRGPYYAGDTIGTVELVSAGGDSSTFNVIEAN